MSCHSVSICSKGNCVLCLLDAPPWYVICSYSYIFLEKERVLDMAYHDQERRRLHRFSVRALAELQAFLDDEESMINAYTRDISSDGAFFITDTLLPIGAYVQITLYVWLRVLKEMLENPQIQIAVRGEVVRANSEGFGVKFMHGYEMKPAEPNSQRDTHANASLPSMVTNEASR